MGKLAKQLDDLVGLTANGSGFGCSEAAEQHQKEIDLLKFKIAQRNNMKIAIISTFIGAGVGAGATLIGQLLVQ